MNQQSQASAKPAPHPTRTRATRKAEIAKFETWLNQLQSDLPDRDGFFGPESESWKVSRNVGLLAFGMRPLLLQIAHPVVAAGVAQHSDYKNSPYGRGFRTFQAVYGMVFDTQTNAREIARNIYRIHTMLDGVREDGTPYTANDPEAMLWVYATLIESAIRGYESLVGRMSDRRKVAYYKETRLFAQLFGVPDEIVPATYSEFVEYFDDMLTGDQLHWTEEGLDVARSLMFGAPQVLQPLTKLYNVIGLKDLPEHLRAPLWQWQPSDALLAFAGQRAIVTMLRSLPAPMQWVPEARAAFAQQQPDNRVIAAFKQLDQWLLPKFEQLAAKVSL